MRRLRRPPHRPALAALLVIGAVIVGCSDGGTEPEPTPSATYQFTGSLPGFPGLDLADARITVTDAEGTVLGTTTVPLTASPSSAPGPSGVVGPGTFSATLQVEAAGTLSYHSEVRDGAGTTMYESDPGTVQGGVDQSVTITSFDYVGPGADVVTIEIDLSGRNVLRVGEEITASARLLDAGGTAVPNVPVHWTVANGDVEMLLEYTESGHARADFRATAVTSAEDISLMIPTGLAGSSAVSVVQPILDDVLLDVTLPLFPGLYPRDVRVELVGDVARDTVIVTTQPAVTEPGEATLQLAVPVDVTFDDAYTATVTVLQSETPLYLAEDVAVIGGGAAAAVALQYTGPGVDADTVEITLQEAEITVGQTTMATATAKDAGGAVLESVPVAWNVESPGLAVSPDDQRQGPREITVEGELNPGTYTVEATLPNGKHATSTLTLTSPTSSGPRTIDFDTYPDGSATVVGPLGTEYSEWGVVFAFMPYSFSQGETTRMPHLMKSGDDGMIENGKRLNGSMATGFFNFEFINPVTTVELSTYGGESGWSAATKIFVLDAAGTVVTSSATITSSFSTHRVEYSGGIGKIVVETGNARMLVLNLTYN